MAENGEEEVKSSISGCQCPNEIISIFTNRRGNKNRAKFNVLPEAEDVNVMGLKMIHAIGNT